MLEGLLINQLEISNIRMSDYNEVVVGIANKYSHGLMYLLFFQFDHPDIFPNFNYKVMLGSVQPTVLELNQLRARVLQVIDSMYHNVMNSGGQC